MKIEKWKRIENYDNDILFSKFIYLNMELISSLTFEVKTQKSKFKCIVGKPWAFSSILNWGLRSLKIELWNLWGFTPRAQIVGGQWPCDYTI